MNSFSGESLIIYHKKENKVAFGTTNLSSAVSLATEVLLSLPLPHQHINVVFWSPVPRAPVHPGQGRSNGTVLECSRTSNCSGTLQLSDKGPEPGSQSLPIPVVPAPPLGLMWMLALSVAVLEAAQACLFCRLPAHGLSGRLARLCSQIEAQWKDCEASWNFSTFALDEVSMNKVTEKTHRVLRVMEIKRSFSSLPLYWQWLQRTKFPEYNREALCSPACWGSTILYNCSTCEGFEVLCWPQKRCFPGSHDLREARILLLCVFGTILLLGVLSLVVEFHFLEAKSDLRGR